MREIMKISTLTFIGFYLNGALGSNKYNHISIDAVKQQLEAGNIFSYLEEELGMDIDLSLLTQEDKKSLSNDWYDLSLCVEEGRKLCVDNNGLCLLMAYILECIQRIARKEKK
jgi:hypothetical protein